MHGGNIEAIADTFNIDPKEVIDFSASLNPLGFPAYTRTCVSRALENITRYPDPDYTELKGTIADSHSIQPENVVLGNGSSELMMTLLAVLKPTQALIPVPSYIDYINYCGLLSIKIELFPLSPESDFTIDEQKFTSVLADQPADSIVILGNPNNPTGKTLEPTFIYTICKAFPNLIFCVDEAYQMLSSSKSELPKPPPPPNLIRIISLTKAFCIPGLRFGYIIGSQHIADTINKLLPCWNINSIAESLSKELLHDKDYVQKSILYIEKEKEYLLKELSSFHAVKPYSSNANFILFNIAGSSDETTEFYTKLLIDHKILLRRCGDFHNLDDNYFRIGIRTHKDNEKFIQALKSYFHIPIRDLPNRRKPALMFAGTSSNAGKSLMAAAFCRVLFHEGYKVAPFKAQNMSLNSFVTSTGGEIGRAQALQARAAGIKPDVRMNPVLLKPNSDTGSQVIIWGKPYQNLDAQNYYAARKHMKSRAIQAYDSLEKDFDVIVLEGAGSPGEVNLKKFDFVNMAMARYAESPVILVGDIDRGGVYASFIGHLEVMEEWERKLTCGFLINKFRGDAGFLTDAHTYMEKATGKPVLGVMPYIKNHRLPEEDGVDFNERYANLNTPSISSLNIGIIQIPHISNSTDIDPFISDTDVSLFHIRNAGDMAAQQLHAIIIPGSKNVISDLAYLKSNGIADEICKLNHRIGSVIIGICGGFQMLGKTIHDPLGIETTPDNSIQGLNLLPIHTTIAEQKILSQTSTKYRKTNELISGYEIHHGTSSYSTTLDMFESPGLGAETPLVWGTYLHGIFENTSFRTQKLNEIRKKFNLPLSDAHDTWDLDTALDEFAEIFKSQIDTELLKKMMGL
jgi:adenosylcobyric acid synthase